MGFDVSFHPVDLALIHERLVPYVMGRGGIDDLIQRAVQIAKIRHRANAWGLGALKLGEGTEDLSELVPLDPEDEAELYEDEMEGSGIIVAPHLDARRRACIVDSDLHVWGRPFFVTAADAAGVSQSIDRYLDASLETVDAIARAELGRLGASLTSSVTPEIDGGPLSDEELAQGLGWKLGLLRRCCDARRQRRPSVTLPDGERADPVELLARELPLALLEFSANFRPGWMARGTVWPSMLLEEAGLSVRGCFEPPAVLVEPIARELSDVHFYLEPTITENYMVGGYVPPAKVGPLREHIERHRARLLEPARGAGCEAECGSALHKILEALSDAERRGLGFAEATEIYSGIQGIMN